MGPPLSNVPTDERIQVEGAPLSDSSLEAIVGSDTVAYVGMWTGIIGAITGVAGAIMGYVAYRNSQKIRESDRRLELDKLRNTVHVSAVSLIELLPKALQSRKATLNAGGMSRSSAMRLFKEQYDRDLKRAAELAGMVPSAEANFGSLSSAELEREIVELDRTRGWISDLVSKYQSYMREDENTREAFRRK